jgi:2-polyprenyl-3-methyl-5-hydroxy-6-metoxy-1,4-benzoquinol methylase
MKEKMTPRSATNPNQALWESGDFTEIAAFMRQSGEVVVESLDIKPPMRALDLGCGDGTTAVPLARAGVDVTGIDISRKLVEAGNKRASELGLSACGFNTEMRATWPACPTIRST